MFIQALELPTMHTSGLLSLKGYYHYYYYVKNILIIGLSFVHLKNVWNMICKLCSSIYAD